MNPFQPNKSRKLRITNTLQIIHENDPRRPNGPGEIFRIEVCPLDIYVVSRSGSIRNPILYVVYDEWSSFIAGFNLSLIDPCAEEEMIALLSVFDDKLETCRSLGLQVDQSEWPMMPIPAVVCGDFGSENAERFAQLGVEAVGPARYRPNVKRHAECIVGLLSHALKTAVGGGACEGPGHAEHTSLSVTLDELKALLVINIFKLNNAYCPTIELPSQAQLEAVPKVPAIVIEWGFRHITGIAPRVAIDAVRRALLPFVDRAQITKAGIRVSAAGLTGLVYRPCTRDLHILYAGGEITEVKVQYDSRCIDFVWATHPQTDSLIRCDLFPPDFRGMSWAEALSLRQQQTNMKGMTDK